MCRVMLAEAESQEQCTSAQSSFLPAARATHPATGVDEVSRDFSVAI